MRVPMRIPGRATWGGLGTRARRLRRSRTARGIVLRRSMLAAAVPALIALEQMVMHADIAPSCAVESESSASAASSGLAGGAQPESGAVALTLRGGVVIAWQTVVVSAIVCGAPGRLMEPERIGLRVEVAGALGRFAVQLGWRRKGLEASAW